MSFAFCVCKVGRLYLLLGVIGVLPRLRKYVVHVVGPLSGTKICGKEKGPWVPGCSLGWWGGIWQAGSRMVSAPDGALGLLLGRAIRGRGRAGGGVWASADGLTHPLLVAFISGATHPPSPWPTEPLEPLAGQGSACPLLHSWTLAHVAERGTLCPQPPEKSAGGEGRGQGLSFLVSPNEGLHTPSVPTERKLNCSLGCAGRRTGIAGSSPAAAHAPDRVTLTLTLTARLRVVLCSCGEGPGPRG